MTQKLGLLSNYLLTSTRIHPPYQLLVRVKYVMLKVLKTKLEDPRSYSMGDGNNDPK